MQVSVINIEADAGLVYVLLVDAAGDSVGAPDIVSVAAGEYPFTLQDVPPGEYRLFAGTDIDDDSFLCDAGEACGAFRTLDAPEILTVEDASTELTDLSFVTEFRAIITSPTAATTGWKAGAYPGFVLPKDNKGTNGAENE
jgi:serine protease